MPGLFEQFPHTNLHELNLDWIIDMINQFKEELEDSAVLSVNGETGHVTLYESENVILPPLPEGTDRWRLVRLVNGQYVGIMFYNNHAYLQRGNETMRLLTLEDIPSDSGVVSWNGLTGVVNVTGQDIPVDDSADADSIEQAITTEITERTNADNEIQNQLSALNGKLTRWFATYQQNVAAGNDFTFTLHTGCHAFCGIASGFCSLYMTGEAGNQTLYHTDIPAGFEITNSLETVTIHRTNGALFSISVIVI